MATESATDRSVGLGLALSIVAVVAALATGALGYQSAFAQDGGETAQVLSGVAFGAAVLAGVVAIVAIHVYGD